MCYPQLVLRQILGGVYYGLMVWEKVGRDNLILPQGRYPESFVLISLLEVCQEWGVKKGVVGGC